MQERRKADKRSSDDLQGRRKADKRSCADRSNQLVTSGEQERRTVKWRKSTDTIRKGKGGLGGEPMITCCCAGDNHLRDGQLGRLKNWTGEIEVGEELNFYPMLKSTMYKVGSHPTNQTYIAFPAPLTRWNECMAPRTRGRFHTRTLVV